MKKSSDSPALQKRSPKDYAFASTQFSSTEAKMFGPIASVVSEREREEAAERQRLFHLKSERLAREVREVETRNSMLRALAEEESTYSSFSSLYSFLSVFSLIIIRLRSFRSFQSLFFP